MTPRIPLIVFGVLLVVGGLVLLYTKWRDDELLRYGGSDVLLVLAGLTLALAACALPTAPCGI